MNKLQLKGDWNKLKGEVKKKWADLTDDDMLAIEGERDQLVGRIQSRYGHTKEMAEKEVKEFMDGNNCCE
jgi:uncharacterized protein YjbJ (UPF0337 family)